MFPLVFEDEAGVYGADVAKQQQAHGAICKRFLLHLVPVLDPPPPPPSHTQLQ